MYNGPYFDLGQYVWNLKYDYFKFKYFTMQGILQKEFSKSFDFLIKWALELRKKIPCFEGIYKDRLHAKCIFGERILVSMIGKPRLKAKENWLLDTNMFCHFCSFIRKIEVSIWMFETQKVRRHDKFRNEWSEH